MPPAPQLRPSAMPKRAAQRPKPKPKAKPRAARAAKRPAALKRPAAKTRRPGGAGVPPRPLEVMEQPPKPWCILPRDVRTFCLFANYWVFRIKLLNVKLLAGEQISQPRKSVAVRAPTEEPTKELRGWLKDGTITDSEPWLQQARKGWCSQKDLEERKG